MQIVWRQLAMKKDDQESISPYKSDIIPEIVAIKKLKHEFIM